MRRAFFINVVHKKQTNENNHKKVENLPTPPTLKKDYLTNKQHQHNNNNNNGSD